MENAVDLLFGTYPSWSRTVVRLALGVVFVAHGGQKAAIAKVHGRHGFFINFSGTPGKGHGFEFNFVLIAMALSIVIGGAGAFSIDCLVRSWGAD